MGTWGVGILQDDVAADVYADYLRHFNSGISPPEILPKVLKQFQYDDPDDASIVWLAIAKAQWDCGHLADQMLAKIKEIVSNETNLSQWADTNEKTIRARKRALAMFLEKLQTPNPRPKKPKKATKRKPLFNPGDCVAVKLDDGEWGALLVLPCPPESEDPNEETFGINLIATLHYKSAVPPEISVFKTCEWLRQTHHSWNGQPHVHQVMAIQYRNIKDRFVLVGNIPVLPSDSSQNWGYASWAHMILASNVQMQNDWDRGIRK